MTGSKKPTNKKEEPKKEDKTKKEKSIFDLDKNKEKPKKKGPIGRPNVTKMKIEVDEKMSKLRRGF